MKNRKQIAEKLHDVLVRELIEKRLDLEEAHHWQPLSKQDKLCTEIEHIEDRIRLLEVMENL